MEAINYTISHLYSTYQVIKDKIYYYYNVDSPEQPNRICKSLNIYEQYSICLSEPTQVTKNIFLGSAFNAGNFNSLENLDIDIIINVTNEINNYYPDDFVYINYKIDDSEADNIEEYLDSSYKILKDNSDKNILVHCYMGASRSASIVIYYLMKENNLTFKQAFDILKNKRPLINPNIKFVEVLLKKEEVLLKKEVLKKSI
jgi:protein-tyrosine phosphatase